MCSLSRKNWERPINIQQKNDFSHLNKNNGSIIGRKALQTWQVVGQGSVCPASLRGKDAECRVRGAQAARGVAV